MQFSDDLNSHIQDDLEEIDVQELLKELDEAVISGLTTEIHSGSIILSEQQVYELLEVLNEALNDNM